MKYVIVVCDGMADLKMKELHGETPLSYAYTPNMDYLARYGQMGVVQTIPQDKTPGSDIANLSILGLDVQQFDCGRASLEALGRDIQLKKEERVLRCNFVTLSEEENFLQRKLLDYSAGGIGSTQAGQLIDSLNRKRKEFACCFYAGLSYRNFMSYKSAEIFVQLPPPQDIIGCCIGDFLCTCEFGFHIMMQANSILQNHKVNQQRRVQAKPMANGIWLWGGGGAVPQYDFYERTGLQGAVVAAVDVIKGIGQALQMELIAVDGATGDKDTNYIGKAQAALAALHKGKDFVFLHIEAADECSHRKELYDKIISIESIDRYIIGVLIRELQKTEEQFSMLVLPDHYTLVQTGQHASMPVPFVLYHNTIKNDPKLAGFTEDNAEQTGIFFDSGKALFSFFTGWR